MSPAVAQPGPAGRMIRGYSARDLGPGSSALEPSSSEPKAVPGSVTDAPGCSRVYRVTAQSNRTPGPGDPGMTDTSRSERGDGWAHPGTTPGRPYQVSRRTTPDCNAPVM